ncbi:MAG: hypothetical protein GX628_06825 [Clostridiales bacterium]|nr:hypothetical protein [Clostridiales bacterium]
MKNEKSGARSVRTVALMMGATVLAKLLGMLRGVLLAGRYGTGIEANAFSEASHIPLTFFDLLLSAAILGCFIPVYNSLKDEKTSDRFAGLFLNLVLLATGIMAFAGIFLAKPIMMLMGGGLAPEAQRLAVRLLRMLFPMIIFTGATYTLVGVMQSKGRFLLPALVSAISNGGIIIYLLFIDGLLGEGRVYGLAAAYLLSWLLQLATLAIPLYISGFRVGFGLGNDGSPVDTEAHEALRKALKMAPPIMLGSWLSPVTLLSGLFFSQYAEGGNVTVFDYANNAYVIIAGILTYSICNYIFPRLSRLAASSGSGGEGDFNRTTRTGLLSALAMILPFTFAMWVLSREGIALLYMRGEFTAADTLLTASALRGISIGMPAFAVCELLSRTFYSRGQTTVPMLASVCGIAANFAVSCLLIFGFGLGMGAVGAAVAAGQWASAIVLLTASALRIKGLFTPRFVLSCLGLAASAALSGAVMETVRRLIGSDPGSASKIVNFSIICAVFAAGAVIYAVPCLAGFTVLRSKTRDNSTEEGNKR